MAGAAAVALAGLLVGGGVARAASVPAYTPVAGSAVPIAGHAAVVGSVPGATKLAVQVWLKPDISAAEAVATAVSAPGGAQYGHYLSPAAYTAAYGPSAASAAAVASWLRTAGFTGIANGPGRAYVRATAPTTPAR
jgi:kumamolisin